MCIPMQRFGATWYQTWNQKLRSTRVEEFGTGSYSGGGETKIPNPTTRVPKFPKIHQQLNGIIMHTFGIQR
jgi:hypothetical protein